jgi:hypothetical protein
MPSEWSKLKVSEGTEAQHEYTQCALHGLFVPVVSPFTGEPIVVRDRAKVYEDVTVPLAEIDKDGCVTGKTVYTTEGVFVEDQRDPGQANLSRNGVCKFCYDAGLTKARVVESAQPPQGRQLVVRDLSTRRLVEGAAAHEAPHRGPALRRDDAPRTRGWSSRWTVRRRDDARVEAAPAEAESAPAEAAPDGLPDPPVPAVRGDSHDPQVQD